MYRIFGNESMFKDNFCVGHTASVPEGREGRSQAGPKGRSLEVGARRAPRLLVGHIIRVTKVSLLMCSYVLVSIVLC